MIASIAGKEKKHNDSFDVLNRSTYPAMTANRARVETVEPNRSMRMVSFISVLFASIVGAKVGPISLNVIGCVILLAYLILHKQDNSSVLIPIKNPYLWMCGAFSLSSLIAILQTHNLPNQAQASEFISSNLSLCVQTMALYVPIFILGRRRRGFSEAILSSLVIVCRIQLIWGLLQYLLWEFASFDLNQTILVEMLGGLGRDSWTTTSNLLSEGIHLRMTGLNSDGAFLGIMMVVGFLLERKQPIKAIYIVAALLSMQRATLAVMCIILLIWLVKRAVKGSARQPSLFAFLGGILCACVAVYCIITIPELSERVDVLLSRFSFMGNEGIVDSGTYRHIMYLPAAVLQILAIDPLIFLFGIGFKSSGVIFSAYDSVLPSFQNVGVSNGVWMIESDAASVAAGCGLIGIITYILFFRSLLTAEQEVVRKMALALLVFGFMYNCSNLVFVQIVYIALTCLSEQSSQSKSNEQRRAFSGQ